MISDILNNVKRLVYDNNRHKLTILYKDLSSKDIEMSEDEYEEMIKTGNFQKLYKYV